MRTLRILFTIYDSASAAAWLLTFAAYQLLFGLLIPTAAVFAFPAAAIAGLVSLLLVLYVVTDARAFGII
jgi:hypothetical protein